MAYTATLNFVTTDYKYTPITNVIDAFEYRCGSIDGYDQPQASVLNISLFGNTINGATVRPTDLIGQIIQLTVSQSNLSTSFMTIGSVTMEPIDSTASNNIINITAYGPLSRFSKVQINRSVIASTTGYSMLGGLVIDSQIEWDDLNGSIQWGDYAETILWTDNSFKGLNSSFWGLVPGADFRDWQSSTGIPQDALSYLQQAAQENDCWLYESVQNGATYMDPLASLPVGSYQTISTGIIFDSLNANADSASKINSVQITNGTVTAYAADGNDIASWGNYFQTSETTLVNLLDIQPIADRIVTAHTSGTTSISSLTVDLDVNPMFFYDHPFLVQIPNLPSAYQDPSGNRYQVRGYSWRGNVNHVEADLVLVPKTVWSYGVTTWLKTTDPWNTFLTATTTWADVA